MLKVFSHPYQLNESLSNFRIVGWYFSFLFMSLKNLLFADSRESDRMQHSVVSDLLPHSVVSDLVLHCMPMSTRRMLVLYGLTFINKLHEIEFAVSNLVCSLHY